MSEHAGARLRAGAVTKVRAVANSHRQIAMIATPARNIASVLRRTACCWPRLPALAEGPAVLCDYATLSERVARLAQGMTLAGVSPGDRIALVSRNLPAYIEAMFATWWAGAAVVPVNARLHPKELEFVLSDSAARWVFVDAHWEAALAGSRSVATVERMVTFAGKEYGRLLTATPAGWPAPRAGDDAAWLFYTSGTTGRPKGVVITHANLLAMSQCYLCDVEAVAPGDALLHAAPLSHGSGLYAVPHVLAAAVHVVPESGGFEPAEIAGLLAAWDRASFFAAPTMVKRLVDSGALASAQLPRLKSIVYGGGPMYVADCKSAFAAFGPRLAQIYGQGESPMTITAMSRAVLADAIARDDDARLASVGFAQTGIELRIGALEGPGMPPGEVGEVWVRGPTVMREYWRNPEATAATLAGGWLRTGDVGSLDPDGFLTLKDRSKDLIISGGANIYPREVEEVLVAHGAVLEVAVVGRVHPEWGEEVVAFVVAREGIEPLQLVAELEALCLGSIARFKRPRHYELIAELPKNNTGKVLKTVLRERFNHRAPTNR
ncbi:MAG: AMP-binding protein [Betaproteobacteria bacterium]